MNVELKQDAVLKLEDSPKTESMHLPRKLPVDVTELSTNKNNKETASPDHAEEAATDDWKTKNSLPLVKSSGTSDEFAQTSPFLNRKNKPPNLVLSDQKPLTFDKNNISQETNDPNCNLNGKYLPNCSKSPLGQRSSLEEPSSADSLTPLVTLPKRIVRIMDAGINGPRFRRSSRIEEILQIPDVQAAIVQEEELEYEKPFKNNNDSLSRPNHRRQQTPGAKFPEGHFSFDGEFPDESESASESESSSLVSNKEEKDDLTKTQQANPFSDQRPHAIAMLDKEPNSNPLNLISNSLGPTNVFNNFVRAENSNKKGLKEENQPHDRLQSLPQINKQSSFLSRFKFSSFKSSEKEVLEGWESLTRALARVGVQSPSLSPLDFKNFDPNPKLISILKQPASRRRVPSEIAPLQVTLSFYFSIIN